MLDKSCAYWMSIGVPYDEFWHGDYTKLKFYDEEYRLKLEMRNHELWLQGMYFYDALCVALHNAFPKKGEQPKKYPEKPYKILEPSEEEKEKEKQKMVQNFREQLMALGRKFEEKHKRERGGLNG